MFKKQQQFICCGTLINISCFQNYVQNVLDIVKVYKICSRSYGTLYFAESLSIFTVFRNYVQNLLDIVKVYRICSRSYGNLFFAENLSIITVFTAIHMLRKTYQYFMFVKLGLECIRYCKSLQDMFKKLREFIFCGELINIYCFQKLRLEFIRYCKSLQDMFKKLRKFIFCGKLINNYCFYSNSYVAKNLSIFHVCKTRSRMYQIL